MSPRPGRGPGSAGRCGHSEALTPPRLGRPGRREVGSVQLRVLRAAQHTGHLPSGPSPRGSHLRELQLPEDGRRGGGREAGPEVEGEAWRPGLGPPQPPPLAASAARFRRWQTRQETSRPSGGNTKTNGSRQPAPARSLASALAPFSQHPAKPGRGLRPPATSPQAGYGDPEPGRHAGYYLPCHGRHLRRRLSLPCQRWPP